MTVKPLPQYSRRRIKDRDLHTLQGICKGMLADGVVNQEEGEYLLNWMRVNDADSIEHPLVTRLFDQLETVLADGILDSSESKNLFESLVALAGEISVGGEPMKSAKDFDDLPVEFEGRSFEFTGEFMPEGQRGIYKEEVHARGGVNASITRKLDYLVVAVYASKQWKTQAYGGKIEKAIKSREKYGKPAVISEAHFVEALESTY
ncbi:MAG: hypothetical protein OXG06_03575 [Gammaproteobacteria bacterium]|nr:hypothetical protein [Gammaproteobacteria bacterium]